MTNFRVNLPPIQFQPELFENLIAERGMPIQWEMATLCSCVRADATTGTPSFNCGVCYNGNVFVNPQTLTAAVTNITSQRNAQIFGELAIGGIFVTVPGAYRLGFNDRITLLNQTMRYSELCEPAVATLKADANPGDTAITVDNPRKFPLPISGVVTCTVNGQSVTYTGKTTTQLTGIPASGAGSIQVLAPAGSPVQLMEWLLRYAPITIFDARTLTTALVNGTDYTITDGRRIKLLTTAALPRFTVTYDGAPVYLVDNLSHAFRDQMLKLGQVDGIATLSRLPVAAVCRRDWVAGRMG